MLTYFITKICNLIIKFQTNSRRVLSVGLAHNMVINQRVVIVHLPLLQCYAQDKQIKYYNVGLIPYCNENRRNCFDVYIVSLNFTLLLKLVTTIMNFMVFNEQNDNDNIA